MKKNTVFNRFSALFLIITIFITSCGIQQDKPEKGSNEPKTDNNDAIAQEQCTKAGGKWNECGSPCAGTDAEFCIQVCSPQCECSGIAGFKCPEGYKCRLSGKKADEIGVCVVE